MFLKLFCPWGFLEKHFCFCLWYLQCILIWFYRPPSTTVTYIYILHTTFTRTYLGLKIDKKSFRFLFQGAKDRVKVFSFYYYYNSIVAQRLSSGPFCVWCSHRGLRRRTKGCPVFGYPPHSPVIVKV